MKNNEMFEKLKYLEHKKMEKLEIVKIYFQNFENRKIPNLEHLGKI